MQLIAALYVAMTVGVAIGFVAAALFNPASKHH
jgi:hypothetical protein